MNPVSVDSGRVSPVLQEDVDKIKEFYSSIRTPLQELGELASRKLWRPEYENSANELKDRLLGILRQVEGKSGMPDGFVLDMKEFMEQAKAIYDSFRQMRH